MSQDQGNVRRELVLPFLEADPLFADAVDEAIAGDAATMPGAQLTRPVGKSPQDFSSLYVRHRASFVAHARRYLRDQRDIDEVVQEAFFRLFIALPELETELQALAYCRRTVTNLCIDRFRAQKRAPRLVGYDEAADADLWDDANVDDPIYAAEDAAIVREALALLSPMHREALVKREIEEKPLPVIAEELGIPEANVKHVLHRARRSLRRILATMMEEGAAGLKSAMVLVLAVVLAVPFVGRSSQDDVAASDAEGGTVVDGGSVGGGVVIDIPTPRQAGDDATGDYAFPVVPQPSGPVDGIDAPAEPAPVVDMPVQPVVPPSDGEGEQPTEPTKPEEPPTGGEGPGGGAHPVKPRLSIQTSAYEVVAAPELARKDVFAEVHSTTQLSAFVAPTSEGPLVLDQSLTQFDDGVASLSVISQLPIGGEAVSTFVSSSEATASVADDGTLTVDATFDVALPHDRQLDVLNSNLGPQVVSAEVVVRILVTPDLASVIAEHVVVTPRGVLAGSADIVDEGAVPASFDGAPPGGQSATRRESAAGVEGQVTSTS